MTRLSLPHARPRPPRPTLVVNGEAIPAAAIAAEAQNHPSPPEKPGAAWSAAARALAVQTLLLQEARRRGLTAEPRALGPGRRETDDEALIRAVIEAGVAPAPPSDADCRAVYASHPDRYRAPTIYAAAHILLPAASEDAAARAAAAKTAAGILAELERDPSAFGRLARVHSACPSREADGRLGQVIAGDTVPEFEAALDRLAPDEIASEPVATRYGLHVIRLDARAQGAVLPYEQVAPAIREALEKGAWVVAAKRLVATLIAGAEITGIDFAMTGGDGDEPDRGAGYGVAGMNARSRNAGCGTCRSDRGA